ncbi:hypothetical protein CC85DRAFT_330452 [Cutaneotrichosporon oleaginosum]|uniref:Uncharacterized protein n=1 Tax=Cutaneotrichosporon oleaginosum TaxID=879819 RepID=A0A0J0XFC1_9TREE|nr:uncharacterized protein CC85DRAFT_330452 [Cutaneotrichosporon oleaginosum]KLT39767.1 hypothetical protein CC85DRAFT_330452 [Cutaneotrichosporon oleaginosum]TXT05688.1 hypothetical protein COLE_07008 [Cutaneotrichosporon oleaginosum]
MTSGEDTDNPEQTTPPRPDVEVLYPPELAPHGDITTDDIAADPILRDLAEHDNLRYSGLGPRLSKSAALRMGLKWEDPRDHRRVSGEEVPVNFDNVPGHKRVGLALNVSSLAEPSVAPRLNRAAMLRAGQQPEGVEVKDRAEMAAVNKAREAAERAERRKSLPRPTSLLLPSQLPRQNRAALLRAGQTLETARPYDAREMAENAARNKAREAAEYAQRRRTIQVPASLAAPAIPPRANRASLLRTGGDAPPPRPPRSHMRAISSMSNGSGSSRSASGSSFKTAGDRALAGKIEAANAAAEKAKAEAERREKAARRRQTMAALPAGEAAGPAALTYNEEKAAAERAALRRIAAQREEEARREAEKAAQDRADRERIEKRRSMTLGRATGLSAAHAIKEVPEPEPEPETAEEREARERVFRRQTFGTAPPSMGAALAAQRDSMPPPPDPRPSRDSLRSLNTPAVPPRANRASLLREREQGTALTRITSTATASTRSRSGSTAASERSDAGIKTSSPKRAPAPMSTPAKFVAPRPAPAPPRGPATISFALPEVKREEKKAGLLGRLLNRNSVGAPASRPGLGNKRASVISAPSPQN